jgi:hypothetical protein
MSAPGVLPEQSHVLLEVLLFSSSLPDLQPAVIGKLKN